MAAESNESEIEIGLSHASEDGHSGPAVMDSPRRSRSRSLSEDGESDDGAETRGRGRRRAERYPSPVRKPEAEQERADSSPEEASPKGGGPEDQRGSPRDNDARKSGSDSDSGSDESSDEDSDGAAAPKIRSSIAHVRRGSYDERKKRQSSSPENNESRRSRSRSGSRSRSPRGRYERSRRSRDRDRDRYYDRERYERRTSRDRERERRSSRDRDLEYRRRGRSPSPSQNDKPNAEEPPVKKKKEELDPILTRTGGAYIPPAKLRMMQAQITDKSSLAYQRMSWEALKKSINGLVNKINVSNIGNIIQELLQENIVRGRGLMARSILQAQGASPIFTHVYGALVSIINSKFPQIGELILKRLILNFRKGYRRNDKMQCMTSSKFVAHLINQNVAHEVLCLEMLTLLLERPTDDSVEVAIGFLKECGLKLTEVSPRGINAIFERLRNILHESEIDKRVQYMIEVMFAIRKDGFKDHPIIPDGLDLVEEEDQFTHMLPLEDDYNTEDILNVFKMDPDFLENEEKYKAIKREILDEGSSGSEDDGEGGSDDDDDDQDEDEEAEAGEEGEKVTIFDQTEVNLVAFRRTIYLAIQSSLDFEECAHKLIKMDFPDSQTKELCNMILDCCAQQRTYEKFFGLLAGRFCLLKKDYMESFEGIFQEQYESIHRLETNKLRNVARMFAHLLYTDSVPWSVMECIKMSEETTTSSSRIFVKILFQELCAYMGLPRLNERLKDPTLQVFFEGLFPRDNPRNTRFAINFFTSIGLGGLTDELREHLKNAPKMIMTQQQEVESSDTDSSSSSSSSDSSDSSSSDSSDSDSSSSSSSSDSDSRKKKKKSQSRKKDKGKDKKKKKKKGSSKPAGRQPRSPEEKEPRAKQKQKEKRGGSSDGRRRSPSPDVPRKAPPPRHRARRDEEESSPPPPPPAQAHPRGRRVEEDSSPPPPTRHRGRRAEEASPPPPTRHRGRREEESSPPPPPAAVPTRHREREEQERERERPGHRDQHGHRGGREHDEERQRPPPLQEQRRHKDGMKNGSQATERGRDGDQERERERERRRSREREPVRRGGSRERSKSRERERSRKETNEPKDSSRNGLERSYKENRYADRPRDSGRREERSREESPRRRR
ncbi:pre-mRNA-splicing factor CWC22 homolog [Sardina pilchardus]|uniref:pre-mRNA-splicing factor CWC22 homolog n=1 Tax=Sardina pilchardus TaxID=27697 RepID=UPI002E10ADC7